MSKSSEPPVKWKSEQLRDQRRERLARMKARDGGKKPIRTGNLRFRLILAGIVLVAILLTAYWVMVQTGTIARSATALFVGNHKISAAELNYYYYSLLQNEYGIDPNTAEAKTQLDQKYTDESFATYRDYMHDQAAKRVREQVAFADLAVAQGLSLTDTEKGLFDQETLPMLNNAAQQQGVSLDNFLLRFYGRGVDLGMLRRVFERSQLAQKAQTKYHDDLVIPDDELQAAYDKARDDYDLIDYRSFVVAAATTTSGATEADRTKAKEEARTKANEMLAKMTDEATFRSVAAENAPEASKADYQDPAKDMTLNINKSKQAVLGTTSVENWLFAAERKAGDKTVIAEDSGSTILYFLKRARDDQPSRDVRHILVLANRTSSSAEQIAAAKKKAEDILAEFQAGDKSDASFAALAGAKTEDPGSKETGGLYEKITKSSGYETEFLNWAIDPARQVGDTGIVQTTHGFHIMYLKGFEKEGWKVNLDGVVRGEKTQAYITSESEKLTYRLNRFGLNYVG